jgi:hypothetical protein
MELPRPSGVRVGLLRALEGPLARYNGVGIQGGEGQVWLVRDASQSSRVRIRYHAMLSIEHPNVALPLGAGGVDSFPYRVDAVPAGVPASEFMLGGSLLFDDALQVTAELSEIIAALHDAGLVHGHLSLDAFHLIEDSRGVHPILIPPPMVDAAPWMAHVAPEVRRGHDADARSDVFGLGYVLISLIYGAPVDGGGSDSGWTDDDDGPAMTLGMFADDEEDLVEYVHTLVDRNPLGRPIDARAVAGMLRSFLPEPTDETVESSSFAVPFDLDVPAQPGAVNGASDVAAGGHVATPMKSPAVASAAAATAPAAVPQAPAAAAPAVPGSRRNKQIAVLLLVFGALGIAALAAGWYVAKHSAWVQDLRTQVRGSAVAAP